jgi:hypothetical protein
MYIFILFRKGFYSGSRMEAIHFDLSPKRREALSLTPLPLQGRGWGLGLYFMQLKTAIVNLILIRI